MSRGRVKPPPKEEKAAPRRVVRVTQVNGRGNGNGPPCPDGHGHMYDLNGRWWCAHSAHGGNGKFYKETEVS